MLVSAPEKTSSTMPYCHSRGFSKQHLCFYGLAPRHTSTRQPTSLKGKWCSHKTV